MFRRILIANRGEVVSRVMRTAKRMGIEVVAITTDADKNLSFLEEADEVINIGGTRAYLDGPTIIEACRAARCTAIHPGWGFLSENPTFSAQCEAAGITFIGPAGATMRQMADKASAREVMAKMGVPTIPGSEGPLATAEVASRVADQIGYPVLLKAVSGGGGRGMRIVREATDLEASFDAASAEAVGAFGDGRLYMEKLIENGRHIEFQVVGDARRAQVLGERECSIQRRHQKLLEETPSPGLSSQRGAEERAAVSELVIRACEAMDYRGAGTIEMLMDGDGNLYFMEMNTRLQVEHTITEEVTGEDLVQRQLEVAANVFLPDLQRPGALRFSAASTQRIPARASATPGVLAFRHSSWEKFVSTRTYGLARFPLLRLDDCEVIVTAQHGLAQFRGCETRSTRSSSRAFRQPPPFFVGYWTCHSSWTAPRIRGCLSAT